MYFWSVNENSHETLISLAHVFDTIQDPINTSVFLSDFSNLLWVLTAMFSLVDMTFNTMFTDSL